MLDDITYLTMQFRKLLRRNTVNDMKLRTRFQDPVSFVQHLLLVNKMRKGGECHAHIEHGVAKRRRRSVSINDINIGKRKVPVSDSGHLKRKINPRYRPLLSDPPAQQIKKNTHTAAKVKNIRPPLGGHLVEEFLIPIACHNPNLSQGE